MALGRVRETCEALVVAGRAATTPVAIVSRATLAGAKVVVGTLANLPERAAAADLAAPALLIVGDVVARRVVSSGSLTST
jgi:siroheme synthase